MPLLHLLVISDTPRMSLKRSPQKNPKKKPYDDTTRTVLSLQLLFHAPSLAAHLLALSLLCTTSPFACSAVSRIRDLCVKDRDGRSEEKLQRE